MEINGVKVGGFWVCKHSIKVEDGTPKVVIEQISVVDDNGKHIKFANLQKIEPFLSKIPLAFSKDSINLQPVGQSDVETVKWQQKNNVKRVVGGQPSEKMKRGIEMIQAKLSDKW